MINYEDFEKVDIRVGKIIQVDDFPEAKRPAYKLTIDFGKKLEFENSSAQTVNLYIKEDLINSFVICVANFEPKQIGPFLSEVLTLGVTDEEGNVILVRPDIKPKIGSKLF